MFENKFVSLPSHLKTIEPMEVHRGAGTMCNTKTSKVIRRTDPMIHFYDEESSAIKALMFKFARLAATSIEHVAQWLVWLAKELGQLTNMELHRADTEVRDIVDGKYDWRIERFENHRGDGLSV